MCLAIPAKVVKISNGMGTIDLEGTQREVSLLLHDDVEAGDYVLVHAGFAIHKIDEEEAKETLRVLREAAATVQGEMGYD